MPSIFADTKLIVPHAFLYGLVAVSPRRLDSYILLLRFLQGSLFPSQLAPFWAQETCHFWQYASCPSLSFQPTVWNVIFFSTLLALVRPINHTCICPRQMSLQEMLQARRELRLIPKLRGLYTDSTGTRMVAICVLLYAFLRLKMDAPCKSCNLSCSVKAVQLPGLDVN